MKNLFLIFFAAHIVLGYSQSGQTVYSFLNIPSSAHQSALGSDIVSIKSSNPSFSISNPSSTNENMHNILSIQYTNYLANSKFGTISYASKIQKYHIISIHARFLDYGKTPRTDEFGNINGDFSARDSAIGLSYSHHFHNDWNIGFELNFISSKIDNFTSHAIGGSSGISYYNKNDQKTLVLVFRNFGYQFKSFNGIREKLPFRIDLGYSNTLPDFPLTFIATMHNLQQWNISAKNTINGYKTGVLRKIADHFSFGAELFPKNSFNIRLGYNIKRGNELAVLDQKSFAGLSAGFGIKTSFFRFDYSHSRYHNASNSNHIGIILDLKKNK